MFLQAQRTPGWTMNATMNLSAQPSVAVNPTWLTAPICASPRSLNTSQPPPPSCKHFCMTGSPKSGLFIFTNNWPNGKIMWITQAELDYFQQKAIADKNSKVHHNRHVIFTRWFNFTANISSISLLCFTLYSVIMARLLIYSSRGLRYCIYWFSIITGSMLWQLWYWILFYIYSLSCTFTSCAWLIKIWTTNFLCVDLPSVCTHRLQFYLLKLLHHYKVFCFVFFSCRWWISRVKTHCLSLGCGFLQSLMLKVYLLIFIQKGLRFA